MGTTEVMYSSSTVCLILIYDRYCMLNVSVLWFYGMDMDMIYCSLDAAWMMDGAIALSRPGRCGKRKNSIARAFRAYSGY
jgi:hypothetical protein